MLWDVENVEAMLVLRAAVLTGRGEETLAHARETMGRDRRVDWHWESPNLPAELKSGKPIKPPSPEDQLRQAAAKPAA